MAKSPEVEHLEKAVNAARKVIEHNAFAVTAETEAEAETEQLRPEAE